MRPPSDFPPAKSANPSARRSASANAARSAAWSTRGASRRFSPRCIHGKLKRNVATPRAASAWAIAARNAWRMPAPAPCASSR